MGLLFYIVFMLFKRSSKLVVTHTCSVHFGLVMMMHA